MQTKKNNRKNSITNGKFSPMKNRINKTFNKTTVFSLIFLLGFSISNVSFSQTQKVDEANKLEIDGETPPTPVLNDVHWNATTGGHIYNTNSGFVGIGSTNPSVMLDVYTNTVNNWATTIKNNSVYGKGLLVKAGYPAVTPDSPALSVKTLENVDMFTVLAQGFVGIGDFTPSHMLDVRAFNNDYAVRIHNNYMSGKGLVISAGHESYNYPVLQIQDIYTDPLFTVLSNGNVGIGTVAPGNFKLAVEGKIGAREIVVQSTAWADFVFEDDYALLPLNLLDQYITDNGHLPEIPSTQEVTQKGINLGEMDAKLLQKIEELTLYLIEQDKKLENLLKQNEQLQKQISSITKN